MSLATHIPPEICFIIFKYLRPPSLPATALCNDIVACSLVCTAWHAEAFSLIERELATLDLSSTYLIDLWRLRSLLLESQKLRLDYASLIDTLLLDLTIMIPLRHAWERSHLPEAEDMVVSFLSVVCPFSTLRLDFRKIWNPSLFDAPLSLFWARIGPLCVDVRHLELCGSPAVSMYDCHLAKLLPSLPNLCEISFDEFRQNFTIPLSLVFRPTLKLAAPSTTRPTLQQRPPLSSIRLRQHDVDISYTIHLLKFFPCLKALHLGSIAYPKFHTIDNLVQAILVLCPLLEELALPCENLLTETVNDDGVETINMLMIQLIEKCAGLKWLEVGRNMRLGDTFLEGLLVGGRNLEILNVSGCVNIRGERVHEVSLPRLEMLDVTGCKDLVPRFVAAVLRGCPMLQLLKVPRWDTGGRTEVDIEEALIEAGFKRTADGKKNWCSYHRRLGPM